MKINIFRGDLTDVSAKKEALVLVWNLQHLVQLKSPSNHTAARKFWNNNFQADTAHAPMNQKECASVLQ